MSSLSNWGGYILKPKSILGSGSGFSSFIFRFIKKNSKFNPIICPVDDSKEWLEKIRDFLKFYDLPTDNLYLYQDFTKKIVKGQKTHINYGNFSRWMSPMKFFLINTCNMEAWIGMSSAFISSRDLLDGTEIFL
ncbi:MAG: hypothetical protein ACTSRZ_12500 [Promethearchaeota archaeon]